MKHKDGSRQRQAEPRAMFGPCFQVPRLMKRFQHMLEILVGHATAVIADRDHRIVSLEMRPKRYMSAGRAEFNGIGNDIKDRLGYQAAVGKHIDAVRRKIYLQRHVRCQRLGCRHSGNVFDNLVKTDI